MGLQNVLFIKQNLFITVKWQPTVSSKTHTARLWFLCLEVLYRISKDTKHCLVLVWKLTDYEVYNRTIFLWNISVRNEVIFKKLYLKTPKCNGWFQLFKSELLRTMCLHTVKCAWFPLFFPEEHNGISPDFHSFVILCIW